MTKIGCLLNGPRYLNEKLSRKSIKSVPQWSSSSAISNHTLRDIRFDAVTMTERWNAGTADSFELEGLIKKFEFLKCNTF